MKSLHIIIVVVASLLAANAGADSDSGSTYSRSQTRRAETVKMGTVESVRQVKIEGTKSGVGIGTGAVVGGIAGNTMGGGRGRILTTVLGAVAGGVAGSAVEDAVTRDDGLEITINLDNGDMIAITQGADEQFHPGERVRVLESGGIARVSH